MRFSESKEPKSFIRYPGSKAKLVPAIRNRFPASFSVEVSPSRFDTYAEPFVGAGAMMVKSLPSLPTNTTIVLNDKDYWMICLWQTVWKEPEELCKQISSFVPSTEFFYEFKEQDGSTVPDPSICGFRKLALHQMSFSGFGVMSGGPLGGKSQSNTSYYIDCRWRPEELKRDIMRLHAILNRFRRIEIRCTDFGEILDGLSRHAFVYLDPPYYEKGSQLYKHSMKDSDHVRLSTRLNESEWLWVLSYDDHPRIRELYSWADIHPVNATYTVATCRSETRPKNQEIVITPRGRDFGWM